MSRISLILLGATIGLSACATASGTISAPGVILAETSASARLAEALANAPGLEAAAARSRQPTFDRDTLAPAVLVIERVAADRTDLQAARRRADAAERRLATVEVAAGPQPAQPSIRSFRSNGLNNLVRTGSDIGQAALGSWPIAFNTSEDRLQAAEMERDAAAAAYRRVLVKALREVGDALVERRVLGLRLTQARAGVAEADATCEAAYQLYQAGMGPEAGWLAAARAATARRELATALQAKYRVADAALLHALGTAAAPRA